MKLSSARADKREVQKKSSRHAIKFLPHKRDGKRGRVAREKRKKKTKVRKSHSREKRNKFLLCVREREREMTSIIVQEKFHAQEKLFRAGCERDRRRETDSRKE